METNEATILQRTNVTDLNQLIDLFNKFEQKHLFLVNDKTVLESEIISLKDQCQLKDNNEKFQHEEMKRLERINANFQKLLNHRCDIEDENWSLKEMISKLENTSEDMEKMHNADIEKWKQTLDTQRQNAEEERRVELKNLQSKMNQEMKILKDALHKKDEDVENLRKELKNQEKEKHSEVVKLKLQYDAKVMKLQQEKVKAQQQVNTSTSVGSSIFRQKLLNAKAASDKEIASLKRTVSEMQRKLDAQNTSKKRRF